MTVFLLMTSVAVFSFIAGYIAGRTSKETDQ
jgi:hypothetical protein